MSWNGKPLSECSKEELIQAVNSYICSADDLAIELGREQEFHKRTMGDFIRLRDGANKPRQKWEYTVVSASYQVDIAETKFDGFGADGWEMVGIIEASDESYTVCFKRPVV